METVYLETTIIGHLKGRIASDKLVAARQQLTRDWWDSQSRRYRFFVSQLVIDECSSGNQSAATERLAIIDQLDMLDASTEADELAIALIAAKAIPATEPRDALHIAVAATNGIRYLLTWNFKHIANAHLRKKIESGCRAAGYEPPTICTPEELRGTSDEY